MRPRWPIRGGDGRKDGWTDGRTDVSKFPPVSYRTSALWGRCPKRKEGKTKRKRGGGVAEFALIQFIKGPASGNRTTPAISLIKLSLVTLLLFLLYEVMKRKSYSIMAAITVRAKDRTAAPIWATSYLVRKHCKNDFILF